MTNDGYANGTSTSSYVNNQTIPTSGGVPVLTVSVSGNNDGIQYQSAIETFGVEYSNYLAYTYEAFTYTNIGGVVDVGVQYHRGEIGGYYAAGLLGATALGGKAGGKAFNYLSHKAPLQTTWGTRRLTGTHITSNGRVEPWVAHYDEYGRQIARTDYTTGVHGIHHHTREYLEYPDNVRVTDHIKGEYQR